MRHVNIIDHAYVYEVFSAATQLMFGKIHYIITSCWFCTKQNHSDQAAFFKFLTTSPELSTTGMAFTGKDYPTKTMTYVNPLTLNDRINNDELVLILVY